MNGFVRKKVETLTVGEKLKKLRSERRISIAEISKNTGIQARYLEALEEGQYDRLPAEVYIRGFLKAYAQYLGITSDALVKLYNRERGIERNIRQEDVHASQENILTRKGVSVFSITPRAITIGIVMIILFSSIFYLYHQFQNFVSQPTLRIEQPLSGEEVNTSSVEVAGYTDPTARVFINDQPVLVDENGKFSEYVELQQGVNTITVRSVNRFDEQVQQELSLNAQFASEATSDTSTEDVTALHHIKFRITSAPTPLFITVDGERVFESIAEADTVLEYDAKEEVVVTAGNGSGVYVTIDKQPEQILSTQDELIRDKKFTFNQ